MASLFVSRALPKPYNYLSIERRQRRMIPLHQEVVVHSIIDQLSKRNVVHTGIDEIVQRFRDNIRGKKFDDFKSKIKNRHLGSEGIWVEEQLGATQNNYTLSDIGGYEIKIYGEKISFGDWRPDEILFDPKSVLQTHNTDVPLLSKDEFLVLFGKPNKKKSNRYAWSGECVPRVAGEFNAFGQVMVVDQNKNIYIAYNSQFDNTRDAKPKWALDKTIVMAYWSREKLIHCISRKFNDKGFILIKKNKKDKTFEKLLIGKSFDFDYWIAQVLEKKVIFDSGMYGGNNRYYSHWRADHRFWDGLVHETYL